MTTKRIVGGKILGGFATAMLMLAAQPGWADDVPADKLTEQEKQRALELDKAKMFAAKEKDLLTVKNELEKAKVDAATPATAAGVTPPSGSFTGAKEMTFAMYMVSLEGLELAAQALCDDLSNKGITKVYITSKDAIEAAAKDLAIGRAREQLRNKLSTADFQVRQMTNEINGTAGGARISAASLTAVASGIDVATGLVKGAAGLAALFKSERTLQSVDNLLTQTEMSAALSMCANDPGETAAPAVNYVDNDSTALDAKIGQIINEVNQISIKANGLDNALTAMLDASVKLDEEIAAATRAKDTFKLKALSNRKPPPNFDAFKTKAAGLVTQAEAYVDTVYQVDATSGLSPLIVSAQFRAIKEAMAATGRLTLVLLKSGGYTLTTKRLLLNDRVDYAGGLAIRATVTAADAASATTVSSIATAAGSGPTSRVPVRSSSAGTSRFPNEAQRGAQS
ncbi:hypothetical protein [Variovorax sp. E3]|uniref:hypothetical protein n=1 Tax=Variovorax sp. E3 TaxID=1914993 RepID=UPI0018DC4232|nr:hypothetical protein [Variovorax sp. E3]